jgi:hypothetical protein
MSTPFPVLPVQEETKKMVCHTPHTHTPLIHSTPTPMPTYPCNCTHFTPHPHTTYIQTIIHPHPHIHVHTTYIQTLPIPSQYTSTPQHIHSTLLLHTLFHLHSLLPNIYISFPKLILSDGKVNKKIKEVEKIKKKITQPYNIQQQIDINTINSKIHKLTKKVIKFNNDLIEKDKTMINRE